MPDLVEIGNGLPVWDLRHTLPERPGYAPRDLAELGTSGPLRYLVVHHTASLPDTTPLQAALYHRTKLGWPGIGYHFWVAQDGAISYTGDILSIRYSVARRNHQLIGICLAGDFTHQPPPDPQLAAARDLLANLQFALGWYVPIRGHRDIALPGHKTACPGDTWPSWRSSLK